RKLSRHDQLVVANWAVLRAMVIDGTRKASYYAEQERVDFACSSPRKPLPNTHVWLATLPDIGGMGVRAGIDGRTDNDRTVGFKVFNCIVGQVALQVVHWKAPGLRGEAASAVVNVRKLLLPIWKKATIQIWPRSISALKLPPKQSLTLSGATA